MNNIQCSHFPKTWSQSSDLFSTAATAALTSVAAAPATASAATVAVNSASAAVVSAADADSAAFASAATQLLRSSRLKSANQAFRLPIGIQQSLKGRSHEILISFFIVCIRSKLGKRSCHSHCFKTLIKHTIFTFLYGSNSNKHKL
jgi:hypothetical protein